MPSSTVSRLRGVHFLEPGEEPPRKARFVFDNDAKAMQYIDIRMRTRQAVATSDWMADETVQGRMWRTYAVGGAGVLRACITVEA